ncbi:MAG: hypothetical protein R3F54_21370 [Alphaproteobacteria bacterium]
MLLTVLLLAANWVIGTWAAFGSGFVDEVIMGLSLIVLVAIVANRSWIPILTINAVLIWLFLKTTPENALTDRLQALLVLVILNLLLLAIFYARRRAIS